MEADRRSELIINLGVSRDLGAVIGGLFLKEQTIGEIRGLKELSVLIQDRKQQLESKLKKPDPSVEDNNHEQDHFLPV